MKCGESFVVYDIQCVTMQGFYGIGHPLLESTLLLLLWLGGGRGTYQFHAATKSTASRLVQRCVALVRLFGHTVHIAKEKNLHSAVVSRCNCFVQCRPVSGFILNSNSFTVNIEYKRPVLFSCCTYPANSIRQGFLFQNAIHTALSKIYAFHLYHL